MTVAVDQIDTDKLSLEQLRDLAIKNEASIPLEPQPEVKEPARDEKTGRFTKQQDSAEDDTEEPPLEEPEDEEPAEKVFTRTIDLADGSGVQVFKASSVEEMNDKLAEAQLNATRKIREQEAKLRKYEEAEKATSADTDYVYSQELMSKPTEAFRKIFKATTGMDISDFKTTMQRVSAFEQAQSQVTAANELITNHPEYIANPRNGKLLEDRVELLESRYQKQNRKLELRDLLNEAYRDLTQSGLLQLKSEETSDAKETTEPATSRIVRTEEVATTQRARKASGLSTRTRTTAPVKSSEPTKAELDAMSLDQLRELAIQYERSQR